MMAQLPEEWKSKRAKTKKSGAGTKRPGFGSRYFDWQQFFEVYLLRYLFQLFPSLHPPSRFSVDDALNNCALLVLKWVSTCGSTSCFHCHTSQAAVTNCPSSRSQPWFGWRFPEELESKYASSPNAHSASSTAASNSEVSRRICRICEPVGGQGHNLEAPRCSHNQIKWRQGGDLQGAGTADKSIEAAWGSSCWSLPLRRNLESKSSVGEVLEAEGGGIC